MPDFLEPFRTWFRDPRGIRKLLTGLAWLAGATLAGILGLALLIALSMVHPALGVLGWAGPLWGMLTLLALGGYGIRLLQNVESGVGQPLPEWEYFWTDAGTGFRYLLAVLIWYVPLLLLLLLASLVLDMDPMGLIERMGLLAQDASLGLGGSFGMFQMLFATAGNSAGGLWLGLLVALYMIGMALLTPGITVAFSQEDLGRALHLPGILSWTGRHWKPVAVSVLILTVAGWLPAALISGLTALLDSASPGLFLSLAVLLFLLFFCFLPLWLWYPYHIYGLIARTDRPGTAPQGPDFIASR